MHCHTQPKIQKCCIEMLGARRKQKLACGTALLSIKQCWQTGADRIGGGWIDKWNKTFF